MHRKNNEGNYVLEGLNKILLVYRRFNVYQYELAEYLKRRNWYIGGDDLIKITSTKENPQLNHIKYNLYNNEYEM